MQAEIILHRDFTVGAIDRRIYGGFVEHLGRAVYGGLYQPEHPCADEDGFRADVLELIRELDMPVTRYPGGNFVSGYRWEDGIGPKKQRPVRLDPAWHALEPNTFGTDEFMKWCRKANTAPMMAVNLGTRGVAEAQQLVEYCNFPGGTALSDLRRANGAEAPHNVKLWCLGNEMDGPWQIGHKDADDYGKLACEAAKVMKATDPSIELVVCGSSLPEMETLGTWEETVLDRAYDQVDYLSIHSYFGNRAEMTPGYLAVSDRMSEHIDRIVACCDAVAARRKSEKKIMLSFDEWNVWFRTGLEPDPPWTAGRPLLEEIYTMEDALVVGMLMMTLLNHADRVKIACLAQSVNVIAPIIAPETGRAWRQTIFHPFALTSRYGRGKTLRAVVNSPTYDTEFRNAADGPAVPFRKVPFLCSACVHNHERGEAVIFAVNRSLTEPMRLTVELNGFKPEGVIEQLVLSHPDLRTVNSETEERVRPAARHDARLMGNTLEAVLEPAGWNMIRVRVR